MYVQLHRVLLQTSSAKNVSSLVSETVAALEALHIGEYFCIAVCESGSNMA